MIESIGPSLQGTCVIWKYLYTWRWQRFLFSTGKTML